MELILEITIGFVVVTVCCTVASEVTQRVWFELFGLGHIEGEFERALSEAFFKFPLDPDFANHTSADGPLTAEQKERFTATLEKVCVIAIRKYLEDMDAAACPRTPTPPIFGEKEPPKESKPCD